MNIGNALISVTVHCTVIDRFYLTQHHFNLYLDYPYYFSGRWQQANNDDVRHDGKDKPVESILIKNSFIKANVTVRLTKLTESQLRCELKQEG